MAYTAMTGDPATPDGLLAALRGPLEIVPGRATYLVRAITPMAKLVNRARGNGRIRPADASPSTVASARQGSGS